MLIVTKIVGENRKWNKLHKPLLIFVAWPEASVAAHTVSHTSIFVGVSKFGPQILEHTTPKD